MLLAPHSGGCSPTRCVVEGAVLLRGQPPFLIKVVVLGFIRQPGTASEEGRVYPCSAFPSFCLGNPLKLIILAQLHIARAIGVLLTAMRARTFPAMAPGEGLVVNLDCVTNRKLSTAARAIHEPHLVSLWHLGASSLGSPGDGSRCQNPSAKAARLAAGVQGSGAGPNQPQRDTPY